MTIETRSNYIRVTFHVSKYYHLSDLVRWICLTFRKPIIGKFSWSTITVADGKGPREILEDLVPIAKEKNRRCWTGMFGTAVIADPSHQPHRGDEFLDADFFLMIQLSAVEYPMMVDRGLVLMGYSTALIPVREIDDQTILWHFETTEDDFQFKPSDLKATKGKWVKKTNMEEFQSKRALIGWCPEGISQLGTGALNPTWSNAESKRTIWRWTGANLQFTAATKTPLNMGIQASLTFERTTNRRDFTSEQNYLRCLNTSTNLHILLYDVSDSRAWLVPLISAYHQMLVSYCARIAHKDLMYTVPLVPTTSRGDVASFSILRCSGSYVVQCSGGDHLTVRELILGFSMNISKTSLVLPKRGFIYGYEFMDIVTDSPISDLKQKHITRGGHAWISLAGKVTCLFCSKLGEAIHGTKAASNDSPCNELPKGHDWLATTIHSINTLCDRYDGVYWSPAGTPFEKCQHGNDSKDSCWSTNPPLQTLMTKKSSTPLNAEQAELCAKGAVVFGLGNKQSSWSSPATVMLKSIKGKQVDITIPVADDA